MPSLERRKSGLYYLRVSIEKDSEKIDEMLTKRGLESISQLPKSSCFYSKPVPLETRSEIQAKKFLSTFIAREQIKRGDGIAYLKEEGKWRERGKVNPEEKLLEQLKAFWKLEKERFETSEIKESTYEKNSQMVNTIKNYLKYLNNPSKEEFSIETANRFRRFRKQNGHPINKKLVNKKTISYSGVGPKQISCEIQIFRGFFEEIRIHSPNFQNPKTKKK